MDINSLLNVKSDIVLGILLGSIPTIILTIVTIYMQYKLEFKKEIAIEKQGYFKEILELIQKIDLYCGKHDIEFHQYGNGVQPGDSEDISNNIIKIKLLIELYFPKLMKSFGNFCEIAYKYADHYEEKGIGEKYNNQRDIFVSKLRESIGL